MPQKGNEILAKAISPARQSCQLNSTVFSSWAKITSCLLRALIIVIIGALFVYPLIGDSVAYAANNKPQVGTITPSSGISDPNQAVAFTATYSDIDGWQNIKYAYLLINTSTSGANCFYGYYNQNTNKLYLRNDANTSWLGGFIPGSSNIIENTYSKLDCSQTTIQGQDNTLTVNWNITFKSAFTGAKNSYLKVIDDANASTSWFKKGGWTITNQSPSLGTITPSSGASMPDSPVSFTTTYSDPDTWPNIQYVYLQINTSTNGKNCFYGYYNQNTNKLYLRNDASTAWLGGFSPGSSNTIENTYSKLDCSQTTVSGQDNTLTVNWNITFKSPFTGAKKAYLYVKDDANAANGWKQKGTWIIDNTPPIGTITINNNDAYTNLTQITLTLSASDSESGVDKMSFSNDNITYSGPENYSTTKDWTLTEGDGEKTVYVKFSDKAGNLSEPYSDTIIYYTATLVSSKDGAEITSSNGKVKVIIPPDALLSDTPVGIICPDPEPYKDLIPENYSLYLIADCQPDNIIFYKPVQLIFTLDSPKVPGTPCYLGLYNQIEDKIELEEHSSYVSTDNLTVTFQINHFSTYAGLTGGISQGSPIGANTKTPLPDLFTGSFSHSIPITVPQGRKGIQPSLTLQYRSSNPNSWTGVGWALNSGYITRQPKKGLPTYNDTTDTFSFVTDSYSAELIYLIDNLYQAKIESAFLKFYKEPDDSWLVVSKDGSTLYLGQDSNSKETGPDNKGFNYYLTKVIDTNSNYITYSYTKDKDKGKCYLDKIEYTGNENTYTQPEYRVDFYLKDRTDILTSYLSSQEVTTAKLLDRIEICFDSELVFKYQFNYTQSPDTERSLLLSVTQSAADGTSFPVQTFEYQKAK